MKVKTTFFSLLAVVLSLMACSQDEVMNEQSAQSEQYTGLVKEITATVAPIEFEGDNETRTLFKSPTKMVWDQNDVIGIFPKKGDQIRFPISSSDVGTTTAHFSGGDWALRANTKYAAYYPFSWDYTGPYIYSDRLKVSYTGQKQNGMGDYCWNHLAKYDYMVAAGQETDRNGCINFEFRHLGAMVHFHIYELEKEVKLARMLIKNDTPIMSEGKFNINSDFPRLEALESSNYFSIDLEDVTIDANYGGDIWAMLPPCTLGGTLCLVDTEGNYYEGMLKTKTIKAGMGYDYNGVDEIEVQEINTPQNAVMISGRAFNLAIKSLVNGAEITNSNFVDHTLTEIEFVTGKSYDEYKYIISTNSVNLTDVSSPYHVYARYLGQGSLLIYTSAKEIDIYDGARMFKGFTSIVNDLYLEQINTSKVTDMTEMFCGCERVFRIHLSKFNTAKVESMKGMFSGCESMLEIDLSSFDTSNVTNMSRMFELGGKFSGIDFSKYPKFNTAKVTDMSDMFRFCRSFNSLDITTFNTSNVRDMSGMFEWCDALRTLNVNYFNTQNVTDMSDMFRNCSVLEQLDLSQWETSNVTNYKSMFYDCKGIFKLTFFPEIRADATLDDMFSGMGSRYQHCTIYTSGSALRMFDQSPEIHLGNYVELIESY